MELVIEPQAARKNITIKARYRMDAAFIKNWFVPL
jgi:hypothetical protein